ncbi:hypothetical protein CARUB_v10016306mg [Capsella rubella]|uniref:Knottin scorpion toxin-like domain-containing protein n=1 Tax=Capsella rubella TaxID=81985 RepID=R0GBK0_9BRAS|nr:putative defensin-like protein 186 [Capsella rubella]EOA32976.1 hypothetical protein CARUB_v10016306mg [Capsella rubella]
MKNSYILLVVIVVVFISSSGEAKECYGRWICSREDKCKEECMDLYKGVGTCRMYSFPSIPTPVLSYMCDCNFDC